LPSAIYYAAHDGDWRATLPAAITEASRRTKELAVLAKAGFDDDALANSLTVFRIVCESRVAADSASGGDHGLR
jgi:hypothetical protein